MACICTEVSGDVRPVSYTHLDVYKRQIVNPCARLMVLTPICPHSMQNRSIVFSAEDQIRIEVEERREPVPAGGIEVIFDGGHQITLKEMCIRDSNNAASA